MARQACPAAVVPRSHNPFDSILALAAAAVAAADLLSDPDTLQAASLHYMGNLGVQRIIEGVVKLRAAFGPGTGKPQHPDVQAYMDSHGGKDPFGE